jgi:hypothetical protein
MRRQLVALFIAACTDETGWKPSIDQGVHGRLTSTSDVVGYPDGVFADAAITVYDAKAAAIATGTSDAEGYYEIALPAGRYEICVLGVAPETIYDQRLWNCAGKCTFFEVAEARVVLNWAANLSGGLWDAGDYCP